MSAHSKTYLTISRMVTAMWLICFMLCNISGTAQKTSTLLYGPNDNGRTYTSLEEALQATEPVYRLKLTKLPTRDSLPEELFQLTELRELTVKGCRLCIVNQRIGELKHLQYLNLDRNKLVHLPNAIGQLTELRKLTASRNLLETLPDSISKLKQLTSIDVWDNPMYFLPESINALENTLQTLDIRQIPIRKSELEAMEKLLPKTQILFTDICECENRRDHD